MVCKLNRSYGFSMTEGDHCIYTKVIGSNFVLLSLYVDDILIASNDKVTLVEVKAWLSSKFDMKDMGEASYVLGVEIHRDRNKQTSWFVPKDLPSKHSKTILYGTL